MVWSSLFNALCPKSMVAVTLSISELCLSNPYLSDRIFNLVPRLAMLETKHFLGFFFPYEAQRDAFILVACIFIEINHIKTREDSSV